MLFDSWLVREGIRNLTQRPRRQARTTSLAQTMPIALQGHVYYSLRGLRDTMGWCDVQEVGDEGAGCVRAGLVHSELGEEIEHGRISYVLHLSVISSLLAYIRLSSLYIRRRSGSQIFTVCTARLQCRNHVTWNEGIIYDAFIAAPDPQAYQEGGLLSCSSWKLPGSNRYLDSTIQRPATFNHRHYCSKHNGHPDRTVSLYR
ncbi:hypothetical protein BU26DRAFT_248950 [Trematosphaeria pertusa]|uniref:Uncharacterized protein n=1 Tax=Trematosphaeria pertusa TaxID=390896 RepID=A0A6A6IR82_9PLEO|nr:uncharacterized protein BU26DRAFT_248950 [Trematosphaeria pertusa]KAF2252033.1 hypothetical protein BU26DRAFT_248950 [Trematosphaeria pertusa]